jgi:hypothetical protein
MGRVRWRGIDGYRVIDEVPVHFSWSPVRHEAIPRAEALLAVPTMADDPTALAGHLAMVNAVPSP